MKKRDIRITLIIIAASLCIFYLYYFTNSLVNGYIEIDAGGADAVLQLRSGFLGSETISSKSEPIQVNNRILKPKALTLSKFQDNNGTNLSCYGPWGNISKIRIKNNETTKIRLGQPLLIKPSISNVGGYVSIGFSIVGHAGEIYEIARTEPVPKIKIIDEQGNTLASGNFAYG